jgi:hypothetical protein
MKIIHEEPRKDPIKAARMVRGLTGAALRARNQGDELTCCSCKLIALIPAR